MAPPAPEEAKTHTFLEYCAGLVGAGTDEASADEPATERDEGILSGKTASFISNILGLEQSDTFATEATPGSEESPQDYAALEAAIAKGQTAGAAAEGDLANVAFQRKLQRIRSDQNRVRAVVSPETSMDVDDSGSMFSEGLLDVSADDSRAVVEMDLEDSGKVVATTVTKDLMSASTGESSHHDLYNIRYSSESVGGGGERDADDERHVRKVVKAWPPAATPEEDVPEPAVVEEVASAAEKEADSDAADASADASAALFSYGSADAPTNDGNSSADASSDADADADVASAQMTKSLVINEILDPDADVISLEDSLVSEKLAEMFRVDDSIEGDDGSSNASGRLSGISATLDTFEDKFENEMEKNLYSDIVPPSPARPINRSSSLSPKSTGGEDSLPRSVPARRGRSMMSKAFRPNSPTKVRKSNSTGSIYTGNLVALSDSTEKLLKKNRKNKTPTSSPPATAIRLRGFSPLPRRPSPKPQRPSPSRADVARLTRISELMDELYGTAANEERSIIRAYKVLEKYVGQESKLESTLQRKIDKAGSKSKQKADEGDEMAAIAAGATAMAIIHSNNERDSATKAGGPADGPKSDVKKSGVLHSIKKKKSPQKRSEMVHSMLEKGTLAPLDSSPPSQVAVNLSLGNQNSQQSRDVLKDVLTDAVEMKGGERFRVHQLRTDDSDMGSSEETALNPLKSRTFVRTRKNGDRRIPLSLVGEDALDRDLADNADDIDAFEIDLDNKVRVGSSSTNGVELTYLEDTLSITDDSGDDENNGGGKSEEKENKPAKKRNKGFLRGITPLRRRDRRATPARRREIKTGSSR